MDLVNLKRDMKISFWVNMHINKKNNRQFTLGKRKYGAFDIVKITYKIAPIQIVLLFILTIIDAILPTSIMAIVTANFVDTAVSIFQGTKQFIYIYLSLFILIFTIALISIFSSFYSLILSSIKKLLTRYLMPSIIEVQANLKYKYIEDVVSQEKLEIVSDEMEETFIDGLQAYVSIIKIFIALSSIIFILLTQIWWVAIIITIFSIPLIISSLWASKKNYEAKGDTRKYERRYSYYSDDILCNREATEERTLFSYTDEITKRYYDNFKKSSDIQLKVLFKTYVAMKLTSISLLVITLLTAITLIQPLILGVITPGIFMGVVTALIGISKNLGWQLQDSIKNIAEAKEYMEIITELVYMQSVDEATEIPSNKLLDFQNIEFKNVIFKYPNSKQTILNGMSFVIEKGKHYAFVGANGVGKSTVIKLLTGLYDEFEGEILINGKDIRSYSLSILKSLFSVIYQDFSKYEVSLKDNIVLGDVANLHDNEEILKILSKLEFDSTIEKLPFGLKTKLGKLYNNSVDLSGGEWQKVAIARSVISQAPVKILDEPTSALDAISENQLYTQFKEIMKSKTSIFITHRLGSIKLVDEIFVIENGIISQKGTHKELVNKCGKYKEMFETQTRWYGL